MDFSRIVLGTASELKTLREYRAWILGAVRREVDFDSAVYVSLSRPSESPAAVDRSDYLKYYGVLLSDPGRYLANLEKGRLASERGVYSDRDVYTGRERDRLPFYTDIVRPQGITAQLVVRLAFQNRSVGSIHLCRHGQSTAFDGDDLSAMRAVVPALTLAQAAHELTSSVTPLEAPTDLSNLSSREREIARMAAAGLSNKDIAALTGTSPNTVRNQLVRVFRKLGVRTRTQLAARRLIP